MAGHLQGWLGTEFRGSVTAGSPCPPVPLHHGTPTPASPGGLDGNSVRGCGLSPGLLPEGFLVVGGGTSLWLRGSSQESQANPGRSCGRHLLPALGPRREAIH